MSIFGDEEVVKLVKSRFVPVAVAIGRHRTAQGVDGQLYRKLVAQRSTESFQGFYIFDARCRVLSHEGGSRHDSRALVAKLKKAARDFQPVALPAEDAAPAQVASILPKPPEGGLIVEVTSKMLRGFEDTIELKPGLDVPSIGKGKVKLAVFNASFGRDRLWIRRDEAAALASGTLPESLTTRIARFHLVDNTRCFPLFWDAGDIQVFTLQLEDGVLTGRVHLETKSGDRGYQAELYGRVKSEGNKVTRFDLVAKGDHWGGKIKGGHRPPPGRFPLAFAFTLSDGKDPFDAVPPAGRTKADYLK